MNLQIKTIILYNSAGKKRILNFELSKVNIITGSSMKGKSSIINIIDYCLGRSEFQISAGIISDSVNWYGIVCKVDEFEIFIAKPKPKHGHSSQSEAYLQISNKIVIPEMQDLVINSNDEAVLIELSKRIGINTNLHIPPEGQTRPPLEANFSHAKFLLFQPQGVIANKETLFYRQNEPFVAQSIRDTMLYFLGIIQEDRLKKLQELQDKRRKYRLMKNTLEESEINKDTRVERGKSLILEAQQVGLLNKDITTNSIDRIIELLTPFKGWQPSIAPPLVEDVLTKKQDMLMENRQKFQETQSEIRAAQTHMKVADGFIGEAGQQILRLESINLFDQTENVNACPVCGKADEETNSSASAIKESLHTLSTEVEVVSQEKPELNQYIQSKQTSLEVLRTNIGQQELEISSLIDEQEAAINFRDSNNRIARVVGRISYYLDITGTGLDDEASELKQNMSLLESAIKRLEEEIDTKNIEDIKASILNILGVEMTKLSESLELEHQYPYRLDLNRLTVVSDRPQSPVIMNQNMGSAANHLGSHLITMLALHRYFIDQKRPVPSFLVLDQPTQVYFPPDRDTDGNPEVLGDEDRQAVEKMFNLLFEISKTTGLQIIVLDHANLNTDEFKNAIVDTIWRDDNALIPLEW